MLLLYHSLPDVIQEELGLSVEKLKLVSDSLISDVYIKSNSVDISGYS